MPRNDPAPPGFRAMLSGMKFHRPRRVRTLAIPSVAPPEAMGSLCRGPTAFGPDAGVQRSTRPRARLRAIRCTHGHSAGQNWQKMCAGAHAHENRPLDAPLGAARRARDFGERPSTPHVERSLTACWALQRISMLPFQMMATAGERSSSNPRPSAACLERAKPTARASPASAHGPARSSLRPSGGLAGRPSGSSNATRAPKLEGISAWT